MRKVTAVARVQRCAASLYVTLSRCSFISSNFAYLSPLCAIFSPHTVLANRSRPTPIGTNYPDPRSSASRCCVEDLAVVH